MYSKRTDVEKPIGNKEPPFPSELCNQYDAVGEGVAGTTNSVEGWHCGLQAYLNGSTTNIWLLLRNLEKDSNMQKLQFIQKAVALLCSRRPRYQKYKNQMQNIRNTYEFVYTVPCLRAIASIT